ncbi:PadR family transcriptional regulator [Rhizobium sp. ERR 922]|nr:PadR family transcriptional regulator [Rhizobium sp. ERR 922]TWB97247.1 PadR family transcriptional regulator [Rhizobium sp. ERR 942]
MKKPGLYGLEMVKASALLKRATIYVHLQRMEEKKWIRSEAEKDPSMSGMPRRRYFITGEGQRAFNASKASAEVFALPVGSAI